LTGCYVDFWHVTEDTLVFTAKTLKLDLSPEKRRQIMHAYLEIKAWPDAPPALRPQKDVGIQMAFLSNFTAAMLDAAVKNAVILLLRTTSIKSLSCHWAPPALWR
jgi:2-haloacid dehalogenase